MKDTRHLALETIFPNARCMTFGCGDRRSKETLFMFRNHKIGKTKPTCRWNVTALFIFIAIRRRKRIKNVILAIFAGTKPEWFQKDFLQSQYAYDSNIHVEGKVKFVFALGTLSTQWNNFWDKSPFWEELVRGWVPKLIDHSLVGQENKGESQFPPFSKQSTKRVKPFFPQDGINEKYMVNSCPAQGVARCKLSPWLFPYTATEINHGYPNI